MAQLPFQAQRLGQPEMAAQRCGMCRQPVPAGQCCCDRCHAAGWSILFYSGVEVEHFDAELWLPARGFEDSYDVSTFGRVRNRRTGRILVASGRYPSVRLGGRTVAVHRLMGETYLGGARPGQVVLHDDDDKTNLWIANLRYGSHSDNLHDAHRHGVRKRLCSSGRHRLVGDNIFIRGDGTRVCISCLRERADAARDPSRPNQHDIF